MLPQTPQLHLGALEHVFSLRLLSQFFCLTPWRYRKKNHPHVKKVGHTSEFFIGIYWWTLKNRNNHNFEKIKKKIPGDIIILHMCTKYYNHMRYSSWDTEWEKLVLSFWAIFCPLPYPPSYPHPQNPENQSFEKMKKTFGDAIILSLCNKNHDKMMYAYSDMECNRHNSYTSVPQMTTIWCMVPEISSVADIIFCHFGLFSALLHLLPRYSLSPSV